MSPATLATITSYQEKLKKLCDLRLSEAQSRSVWYKILTHHKKMQELLARPVDLVVSALDFLKTKTTQDLLVVNRESYQEAWTGAYRDSLTGLYNRRYLMENLKREIEKSKRYHLSFSLCYIDLDFFKSVNDRFGHLVGDLVLQKAAKLIKHMSRDSDLTARIGGEEFVVLMPQTTDRMALKAIERLRKVYERKGKRIQDPVFSELTLSAGIVSCPHDTQNMDEIMQYADLALYTAKREGRNRVFSYTQIKKHGQSVLESRSGEYYEKAC